MGIVYFDFFRGLIHYSYSLRSHLEVTVTAARMHDFIVAQFSRTNDKQFIASPHTVSEICLWKNTKYYYREKVELNEWKFWI
jgi:hypothetical protein